MAIAVLILYKLNTLVVKRDYGRATQLWEKYIMIRLVNI